MPLVVREHYQIDLEYNEDFAILHLPRVDKVTKTVYKDIQTVSEDIKKFLRTCGYQHIWAASYPEDTMIHKLLDKFGFEKQGEAEGFHVFSVRS